jgi:site-specific DNA-methyltransferase (adenine-specific)
MLLHGDCLELMKTIPDSSVDMILTDPPYGTTACKWDTVIPFEPMWEQIWRVLKPNGACLLFGSEPFSSALRMSQIKRFKYDWIWEKNGPTCHVLAKCKPMPKHEIISVFSTGTTYFKHRSKNPMPYYPQGLTKGLCKTVLAKSKFNDVNYNRTKNKFDGYYQGYEYTNYPTSILKYGSKEKRFHPTQKPVALLEYLIKTYTLEGETVLDFTMGSGSTGVACVNTGRKFIGIEMDDKYFEIAKQRISASWS